VKNQHLRNGGLVGVGGLRVQAGLNVLTESLRIPSFLCAELGVTPVQEAKVVL